MKKPFILTLLALLVVSNLSALENQITGARAKALSNAYVSVSDLWSSFHNQAGLAGLQKITAGVFFESRFLVDELSLSAAAIALPHKSNTLALSFYQFGKGSFKENKIGLAFAKQLSEKISAGIQLDYFSQRFPENNRSSGLATFETGVIFRPAQQLYLGAHVFNAISAGMETLAGPHKIPATYRFGGHYFFDKTVMVIVETQKTIHQPLLLKTGIEFVPIENLDLRFGVSGKPFNITAGFGYRLKNVRTDFGFSYHGNLGLTPSISIQIEL